MLVSGVASLSSLMLCDARSIHNQITVLQDIILHGNFDLACFTETWVREDGTVFSLQLALPGFFVLHQPQTGSQGGGVPIPDGFSFWRIPALEITGIEGVGLVWGARGKFAILLLYCPPRGNL